MTGDPLKNSTDELLAALDNDDAVVSQALDTASYAQQALEGGNPDRGELLYDILAAQENLDASKQQVKDAASNLLSELLQHKQPTPDNTQP